MSVHEISPRELFSRVQVGELVDLIDVRTPAEYESVHVEIARLVPLDNLDPKQVVANRNGDSNKPLYIICKSGVRGRKACDKFVAAGYDNVVNVVGGTMAWEKDGLPVKKGSWVLPLDQQIQMVAGSMALGGVVLAHVVHPAWMYLSGFVGCGLLMAGITGFCPMAVILAKMPWNKGCGCTTSCSIR